MIKFEYIKLTVACFFDGVESKSVIKNKGIKFIILRSCM